MRTPPQSSTCPRCAKSEHVRSKMLLVDSSGPCPCFISFEQVKPDFIQEGELKQFIPGFYCDQCAIGFLADEMTKEPEQSWKLSPEGWHPVHADGSLGPPQPLPK